MTYDVTTTGYEPRTDSSPPDGGSPREVAQEQAAGVAGGAKDAGRQVAGVAKDEAANVASEATRQAKDVAGQARDEISRQAADQQQRVAGGLRSLGQELGSMADNGEQSGMATDLARQAATRIHEAADWLEQRDPKGLLDEVTSFARRRPGAFLAVAAGAGLLAGRLTRSLKDDSSAPSTGGSATRPTTGPSFETPAPGEPVYAEATPYGQATPYAEPVDYADDTTYPARAVPVEPLADPEWETRP
jgi:hypothetical protein